MTPEEIDALVATRLGEALAGAEARFARQLDERLGQFAAVLIQNGKMSWGEAERASRGHLPPPPELPALTTDRFVHEAVIDQVRMSGSLVDRRPEAAASIVQHNLRAEPAMLPPEIAIKFAPCIPRENVRHFPLDAWRAHYACVDADRREEDERRRTAKVANDQREAERLYAEASKQHERDARGKAATP